MTGSLPTIGAWYPIGYHQGMDSMDASQLLRTARHESELTLRELAGRAGTSHSTLSAYENGSKVPSVATLERIVGAAGFALDTNLRRRYRIDGTLTRGDELEAVLELADQFPARHTLRLQAPVFPRLQPKN